MKLELKHIVPYLPYELEFNDPETVVLGVMVAIVTGMPGLIFYEDKDTIEYYDLSAIKPLLIPMSELTKEELRAQGFHSHIDFLTHEKRSPIGEMGEYGWKDGAPWEMVTYLFSKHFDVFGLIDAGLAINKLLFNPKQPKEPTNICNCGVPLYLHATCCGWLNANYCITPKNDEEREYKRLWEEAHPNTGFAGVPKELPNIDWDGISKPLDPDNYPECSEPKEQEKEKTREDVLKNLGFNKSKISTNILLAMDRWGNIEYMNGLQTQDTRISELEARVKELEEALKSNESELINAAKYGYVYHMTTQFPELSFNENCRNNFLQFMQGQRNSH
jgi:hypothetical protein